MNVEPCCKDDLHPQLPTEFLVISVRLFRLVKFWGIGHPRAIAEHGEKRRLPLGLDGIGSSTVSLAPSPESGRSSTSRFPIISLAEQDLAQASFAYKQWLWAHNVPRFDTGAVNPQEGVADRNSPADRVCQAGKDSEGSSSYHLPTLLRQ
jgi:hypothetical protein